MGGGCIMNKKDFDCLTKILDEEIYNFKQLLKYEKLKNSVIINQEVEKLKQLSSDEEEILDKVAKLEEERENVVGGLFKEYSINSEKVLSSLIKNLPENENNFKDTLRKKKDELVSNIKDLKRINEINNRLLMDSAEFFNYAANCIQDMDSVVYDKNGTMPSDYESSRVINKRA